MMDITMAKPSFNIINTAKLYDFVYFKTKVGCFIIQVTNIKSQAISPKPCTLYNLKKVFTVVRSATEINGKSINLRTDDVEDINILQAVKIDAIKVSLVYFKDTFRTKSQRHGAKWLRYILKHYGLISNSVVYCEDHPLAKLINLAFIKIELLNLKSNKVAKVTSNTTIEVISEMDKEFYCALKFKTMDTSSRSLLDDETEQTITSHLYSMLKCCNKFSPIGFRGVKGLVIIDPSSFLLNQLITKCIFKCGSIKLNINPSDVLSESVGESEILLKDQLEKARLWSKECPVVIVIEDIDSLFPNTNLKSSSGISRRILSIFLSFLDEESNNIFIIGTVKSLNDLNSAVIRPGRLDKKVIVGHLSYNERLKTLRKLFNKNLLSDNITLETIAEKTPEFGVSDFINLWQHIVYSHLETLEFEKNATTKIKASTVDQVLLAVRPTAYKSFSNWKVNVRPQQWDEIVGMDKTKNRIKMAIEWPLIHSEAFKRLGLSSSRGVLLFGPPGCCKTTLIRGVASMCKAMFLSATPAQIFSPYVGDSSKAITEIFQAARSASPSLIFLDEIESLVGARQFESKTNSVQRGVQEQVLSALLNEMDGIGASVTPEKGNVVVIGITNRFDLLDAALLRPGRFDSIVYVGEPDINERKAIIEKLCEKLPVEDVNIEYLAQETSLYSGADLKNLCQEAALKALDEDMSCIKITSSHFDYALRNMQPSLNQKQIQWFNEICQKNNITNG